MSFSIVYLAQRFLYRLWQFIYDWYVGGFMVIGGKLFVILEALDRTWAFKINLRNLFKPLYQDLSLAGRGLGFLLRLSRLVIAGLLYALILLVAAALYLGWAGIPLYVIKKGFFNNL